MLLLSLGFKMEKAHLPSGIREQLYKEEVSFDELRRFLDYLQHVCECTEIKIKQFNEAEKEPVNADEDGSINVGVKI
jgi:Mn-dependent DtxR family transcriptional regulator